MAGELQEIWPAHAAVREHIPAGKKNVYPGTPGLSKETIGNGMSDKTINEKQLHKAYMDAFSTASGNLVLKDLGNRCFKHDTTHVPGDRDATFINEGKRQMLLTIETMMSPEGIAILDEGPGKESE